MWIMYPWYRNIVPIWLCKIQGDSLSGKQNYKNQPYGFCELYILASVTVKMLKQKPTDTHFSKSELFN